MALKHLYPRLLRTKATLFTTGVYLVSIWSLAVFISTALCDDMRAMLSAQQLSSASLVAAALDRELTDRLTGLDRVSRKITPELLRDVGVLQAMLLDNPILHNLFNAGVAVHGADAVALATAQRNVQRVDSGAIDTHSVAMVLRTGRPHVGRAVAGSVTGESVFAITVPIRDTQDKAFAALSGVTHLGQPNFLDPFTANGYGKTGGYQIIAPQQRLVIAATDKSRAMEDLPGVGVNAEVDRFVNGYRGSVVFVNPVGVEVLASVQSIGASGWYVAVSLPTAEAFAPITRLQQRLFWAAIVLTLLAAGLTLWMLKHELGPLRAAFDTLGALARSQSFPPALPVARQDEIGTLIGAFNHLLETLAQRESQLQQVMDTTSVAIFVVDRQGLITKANRRMAQLFGCNGTALVGADYFGLVHPDERAGAQRTLYDLLGNTIAAIDQDHRYCRADHSTFWGHLTAQRLVGADGQELGLVGVIADVTERMEAEHFEKLRSHCLELIAKGAPLPNILNSIVLGVQRLAPAALCRIVLLDEQGQQVFGAGGSGADWQVNGTQPVLDANGRVLGSVALHVRSDTAPLLIDTVLIERLVNLVNMAVESQRANETRRLAVTVFDHAREGILITKADGSIIDVNQAFTRITGYARDDVVGQNPRMLSSGRHSKDYYVTMWREIADKGYWYGEVWNRRKNGEIYAEMQTISMVRDGQGKPMHYVALFSDITAQKEQQQQLERIAHFDALTGLPNRALLADRMGLAMAQAERRGNLLALVFLDLDAFKPINDTYGHDAGDRLLIALTNRMKLALREGDTLARLGGDEFVVVLTDLVDASACQPLLIRLLEAAAQAVQVGQVTLAVSASLGVTFYPQKEAVDADTLLRQADQAMYQAKIVGKNRYHIFDTEQDRSVRGHHESL